MGHFDANRDGFIDRQEFFFLIEYIFVVNYLESTRPKSQVTPELRAQLSPTLLRLFQDQSWTEKVFVSFDEHDATREGKVRSDLLAPTLSALLMTARGLEEAVQVIRFLFFVSLKLA